MVFSFVPSPLLFTLCRLYCIEVTISPQYQPRISCVHALHCISPLPLASFSASQYHFAMATTQYHLAMEQQMVATAYKPLSEVRQTRQ